MAPADSSVDSRISIVAGNPEIDDVDRAVERLQTIGETHDVVVQGFDARYVAGRAHLAHAARLAKRARAAGDGIADDPAVEVLLYAAGRRQIERALEMGLSVGAPAAVVVSRDLGSPSEDSVTGAIREIMSAFGLATPDDPATRELLAPDEDQLVDFFGIEPTKRDATDAPVARLVRERCTLLAVNK